MSSLSLRQLQLERRLGASPARLAAEGSRGDFSPSCELYPGKRVVMVTVNLAYYDFFENWLHFAKPHLKSSEQLVVVTEDSQVENKLKKLLQEQLPEADILTPNAAPSMLQQAPPYDSAKYGDAVWTKPDNMLKFLKANCSVLYADIDTAWVKDPFSAIGAADTGNVYLVDDTPIVPGLDYCTCFLYVQPTPATLDLIEQWGARREGNLDQPVFNKELRARMEKPSGGGIELVVLPAGKFPPGNLAWTTDNPTVLHCNWRKGVPAKVDFMKRHHVWTLERPMLDAA